MSSQFEHKILNITYHKENANQKLHQISPQAHKKWLYESRKTAASENVEKKKTYRAVGGNVISTDSVENKLEAT